MFAPNFFVMVSEDSGNSLNENKDKTDNHFYSPV